MKSPFIKIIFSLTFLLITCYTFAQAPQAFNYQAVARDVSGNVLPDQILGIKVSLHMGTATGAVVYSETFTPTSNSFGLFTIGIGLGTAISGQFDTISWGKNHYYMQVEMDPAGGATYVDMGTSQLLSVPYAMYAAHTEGIGFSAYRSATTQLIAAGSYTEIVFNSENYDDGNGYNPTNGYYTAPSAGVYHFDASARLTGTATEGQTTVIVLVVNGNQKRMKRMLSETDAFSIDVSADLKLNAGDIVNVEIYSQTETSAMYINNICTFFSGHKVY
ncbi:MAG TPA: hypothetical protein PKW80_04115 [Bacteroidales bacterium]|nr:hypothetical protein [Bacteroidales bacterium]